MKNGHYVMIGMENRLTTDLPVSFIILDSRDCSLDNKHAHHSPNGPNPSLTHTQSCLREGEIIVYIVHMSLVFFYKCILIYPIILNISGSRLNTFVTVRLNMIFLFH